MGFFKRRASQPDGATATLDPLPQGREALLAEIEQLTQDNGGAGDRDAERRLLRLRHAAGVDLLNAGDTGPRFAEPDDALPGERLPEIAAADLTPELVRAGILRDGCLLVRGLVEREAALGLAASIDGAFAARDQLQSGATPRAGHYEEFEPEDRFDVASVRPWIQEGGGVLAVDAPRPAFEMFELFRAAGLPRLVHDYLGEPPLISAHKTTLRKAEPTVGGAWHQDGAFMGDVRALNLWLSLSRCGDEAPGLDIVPRRMEEIVIAHDAMLDIELTRQRAREAAEGTGILRPIFEPGDALFFDEMFLHQTGSDPAMPNPRFAVESWFFGASAFPSDYAPIAV
jgi:Phytanoyl-CoA dioxygenase (PhyH)